MAIKFKFNDLASSFSQSFYSPETCPGCHARTSPCRTDKTYLVTNNGITLWLVEFKCNCGQHFVSLYIHNSENPDNFIYEPIYTYPEQITNIPDAAKDLEIISPDFVKIYSQAMAAKNEGLDSVVGPALRKAIEFLVKDYLFMTGKLTEDQLQTTPLRTCIKDHLNDNDTLLSVADASALIGNDEVHWRKDLISYDLEDMITFSEIAIHIMSSKAAVLKAKKVQRDFENSKKAKKANNTTDK